MVGLAQMVRASDCGPEGRRFDPDIPPHQQFAGVVQRLVCKFSKLEIGFRLPSPAPFKLKDAISAFFRARSSNRRTSHEENTNLAPFILEWSIILKGARLVFFDFSRRLCF